MQGWQEKKFSSGKTREAERENAWATLQQRAPARPGEPWARAWLCWASFWEGQNCFILLAPWLCLLTRASQVALVIKNPSTIFLPGESHGQGSLVGYSPWGPKESDTAEAT